MLVHVAANVVSKMSVL